jgi:hypothetical protein
MSGQTAAGAVAISYIGTVPIYDIFRVTPLFNKYGGFAKPF